MKKRLFGFFIDAAIIVVAAALSFFLRYRLSLPEAQQGPLAMFTGISLAAHFGASFMLCGRFERPIWQLKSAVESLPLFIICTTATAIISLFAPYFYPEVSFKVLILNLGAIFGCSVIHYFFYCCCSAVKTYKHKKQGKDVSEPPPLNRTEFRRKLRMDSRYFLLIPIYIAAGLLLYFPKSHLGLDIPTVNLELTTKSYHQLMNDAATYNQLDRFYSDKEHPTYRGFIRKDSGYYSAKVRIKGDFTDHMKKGKESIKVKFDGEGRFLGMREFSLMHPQRRHGLSEWLLVKLFSSHGYLGPRYDFVLLNINGESRGIYAIEELFTKENLEHQGRLESVVLKLREDFYWRNIFIGTAFKNPLFTDAKYEIMVVNESKIRKNPRLSSLADKAVAKFSGFLDKELPLNQVFDPLKLARFLALTDVTNASHATYFETNARWYFDPITELFEPIFYDAEVGIMDGFKFKGKSFPLTHQFIRSDLEVLYHYYRYLREFSEEDYFVPFLNKNKQEWDRLLSLLQSEWRGYSENTDFIRDDVPVLFRKKLRDYPPHPLAAQYELRPSANSVAPAIAVRLATEYEIPLEIVDFAVKKNGIRMSLPVTWTNVPEFRLGEQTIRAIPRSEHQFEAKSALLELSDAQLLSGGAQLVVTYRPFGLDTVYESQVDKISPLDSEFYGMGGAEPSLDKFSFIEKTGVAEFVIRSGHHIVKSDIVIPKFNHLLIEAGATLDFAPGTKLRSFSRIDIRGRQEAPVTMTSTKGFWHGLQILHQPGFTSTIHWLNISKARALAAEDRTFLSGALTLIKTNANISHLSIADSDGLGIRVNHGKTTIDTLSLKDIDGVGLRYEDASGRLSRANLTAIDGDGIRFMHSSIDLFDLRTSNIKRTALTYSGAATVSRLQGANIQGSSIGIVSQDGARFRGTQLHIEDMSLGLSVYSKKNAKPASLSVSRLTSRQISQLHAVGKGSTMTINSEAANTDILDTRATLKKNGHMF